MFISSTFVLPRLSFSFFKIIFFLTRVRTERSFAVDQYCTHMLRSLLSDGNDAENHCRLSLIRYIASTVVTYFLLLLLLKDSLEWDPTVPKTMQRDIDDFCSRELIVSCIHMKETHSILLASNYYSAF